MRRRRRAGAAVQPPGPLRGRPGCRRDAARQRAGGPYPSAAPAEAHIPGGGGAGGGGGGRSDAAGPGHRHRLQLLQPAERHPQAAGPGVLRPGGAGPAPRGAPRLPDRPGGLFPLLGALRLPPEHGPARGTAAATRRRRGCCSCAPAGAAHQKPGGCAPAGRGHPGRVCDPDAPPPRPCRPVPGPPTPGGRRPRPGPLRGPGPGGRDPRAGHQALCAWAPSMPVALCTLPPWMRGMWGG